MGKICWQARSPMACMWHSRRTCPQGAPKGRSARPQRANNDGHSELARVRCPRMARMSLPLRASNEGLLRPRVARAQETHRAIPPFADGFFQHPARTCWFCPVVPVDSPHDSPASFFLRTGHSGTIPQGGGHGIMGGTLCASAGCSLRGVAVLAPS